MAKVLRCDAVGRGRAHEVSAGTLADPERPALSLVRPKFHLQNMAPQPKWGFHWQAQN
jgi:hypothetical protein